MAEVGRGVGGDEEVEGPLARSKAWNTTCRGGKEGCVCEGGGAGGGEAGGRPQYCHKHMLQPAAAHLEPLLPNLLLPAWCRFATARLEPLLPNLLQPGAATET